MCLFCALYTNVHPVCFPDQETPEETTSDQQQTVPLSDEELRQRRVLHLESKFLKVSLQKRHYAGRQLFPHFHPAFHRSFPRREEI